jgi:hypothetical protein
MDLNLLLRFLGLLFRMPIVKNDISASTRRRQCCLAPNAPGAASD